MFEVLVGTLYAVGFVASSGFAAHAIACRLAGAQSVTDRTCSVLVFQALILLGVFHLLLPFDAFARGPAFAVLFAAALGAAAGGHRPRDVRRDVRRLARGGRRVARVLLASRGRWLWGLFAVGVTATIARATILPPLGWDTLTYHYVKAALWVQQGGAIALDAPGGWSLYRDRFANGEVLQAWAMLAYHGDLLVGWVDVVSWIWLACGVLALGQRFGLRPRERAAAALAVGFMPAAWYAVGAGYVDLFGAAALVTAVHFALALTEGTRDSRGSLAVSLAAGALALGARLTFAPAIAGLVLMLVVAARNRSPHGRSVPAGEWGVGALASTIGVVPWLGWNLARYGSPLDLPISLGPFLWGPPRAALDWYQDRSDLAAFQLEAELDALGPLFGWPWQEHAQLGVAAALAWLALPVVLICGRSLAPASRGLLALVVAGTVAVFLSPAFSVPRLLFPVTNGRFLLGGAALAIPLAFLILSEGGKSRARWTCALLVVSGVHLMLGFRGLTRDAFVLCAAGGLFFASIVAGSLGAWRRPVWIACLAALVGWPFLLEGLHRAPDRWLLLTTNQVLQFTTTYWAGAAAELDVASQPKRIAVTGGPHQLADYWQLYYFLGRDLQNELVYVPISSDGEFIPFGPHSDRSKEGDRTAWLARLVAEDVSHVVTFLPPSVELGWMLSDPMHFKPVARREARAGWGVFGFDGAPPRIPERSDSRLPSAAERGTVERRDSAPATAPIGES